MQYQKTKSIAKTVYSKGPQLESLVLNTVGKCAEVVGSTLGPGGMSVLIERQEQHMPPMVTKDGVTVFRNLGFTDSTAQVIMEACRDAALRTASEAGDGTTSSTILANGFVMATNDYCKANPKVSPQRVVRTIEHAFKTILEPWILQNSKKADLGANKNSLHAVAKVSANGDVPLADAVMECFKLVGDEGNVTIIELNGHSKYEVERLEGFGMPIGYEDCCGPFYQKFINDTGTQSCQLDNPLFVLYYGHIKDISVCANLFEKIIEATPGKVPNIVLVATGFSEVVLGHLAVNFSAANKNINVFPLMVPMGPTKTGQHDFLKDLSALTGGEVFDMLQKPLDTGTANDLGFASKFEASRFRSNIIVQMDDEIEERVFTRTDDLHKQLDSVATAELDKQLLRERIGKLTGGIAKLKIFGSSNGELREKRDRAEDAICAVRGAIKHGTLPASGYSLVQLSRIMAQSDNSIYKNIIAPALMAPVRVLFRNAGFTEEETEAKLTSYSPNNSLIFDLLEGTYVDAYVDGLLDSTPAVLEALRNSISIATLLGTLGGTVVFKRDGELERKEAIDSRDFLKSIEEEPITERP